MYLYHISGKSFFKESKYVLVSYIIPLCLLNKWRLNTPLKETGLTNLTQWLSNMIMGISL